MKDKVEIQKITYNGIPYKDVSLKLSKESIENLAVYVKELSPSIFKFLGFPSLARSEYYNGKPTKISREYRIKGTANNDNLELLIEKINYDEKEKKYSKVCKHEANIEKYIKAYLREISSFNGKIIDNADIAKAAKSWNNDLGMSDEAVDILKKSVENSIVQYKTVENKLFYVPYLGFIGAMAGQFISVGFGGGQKYQRRISPILGLPPFNVLNNLARELFYGNPAPVDVVVENPKKTGIILPPVVGFFAKKHEIRHALQYASFYELINPSSKLFSKFTKEAAKNRAYGNLGELLIAHLSGMERMFKNFNDQNKKIPTEFFKGECIKDFYYRALRENILDNEESRGIIAGALFTGAHANRRRLYESTASSLKGNIMILSLPWIIPGIVYGFQNLPNYANTAIIINILLMMGGYGNLFSYNNLKSSIKYASSPEEELKAVANIGLKIKISET